MPLPPVMKQPWEYDAVNQRYNFNSNPGMIGYDEATQTWGDTGESAAPGQLEQYLRDLGAAPIEQQMQTLGGAVAPPQQFSSFPNGGVPTSGPPQPQMSNPDPRPIRGGVTAAGSSTGGYGQYGSPPSMLSMGPFDLNSLSPEDRVRMGYPPTGQIGNNPVPIRGGVPANPSIPAGSSTGYGYSQYAPGSTNPPMRVLNPTTGQMQTVNYQEIEPLLNQGWRPVDSTGQPFEMQQFNGGWVAASNQGWVPFNVINGQGWQPGQQEAIANGMKGGQLPAFNNGSGNGQFGSFPNGGQPSGGQPGITDVGATPGFGSFAQPFSETFNPNAGTFNTNPFTEDFNFDYDTALQSPAFRRRLSEGAKLIEGAAANRGGLYSGRTGKELMRFGQEMTSDELTNEYGRAWNQFQDKKGTHWTNEAGREADYNKALNEYRQRHDIFKGNQTDIFNRFASLSGTGQTAGTNLGSTGASFGNTLANSILAGGQARGNGVTNSANARIGGISGAAGNVQDLLLARQYGLI